MKLFFFKTLFVFTYIFCGSFSYAFLQDCKEDFSKFDENYFESEYKIVSTLGRGTYSTVFLCSGKGGQEVAVKRYRIDEPDIIEHFKNNNIDKSEFVKNLALNEWEIGLRCSHKNIVQVLKAFYSQDASYVVMEYIPSETFDPCKDYSEEERLSYAKQFLSAVEHLLFSNVIVDDLYSNNLMLDNDRGLMLIDLGGYEIINKELYPVKHYVKQIEYMFDIIGKKLATKALKNCRFFSKKLKKSQEFFSTKHIEEVVFWLKALQKELSAPLSHEKNTLFETSLEGINEKYQLLQKEHVNDISFITAQPTALLTYSIAVPIILQKFHPEKFSDSYLENIHFLRYPYDYYPKTLHELFERYPLREDYDSASYSVSDALISASPSLAEKEDNESAWAIFAENSRKCAVADYLIEIFQREHVFSKRYAKEVKKLVKLSPKSEYGLLYNFFIPKQNPFQAAVYLSEAYGLPIGNPLDPLTLQNFYAAYNSSEEKETAFQIRFLPAALFAQKTFSAAASYRMTTLPSEEFASLVTKVQNIIDKIFKAHLKDSLSLAKKFSNVENSADVIEKQQGYKFLCQQHLERRDLHQALYFWNKLEGYCQYKKTALTAIVACLLKQKEFTLADNYFTRYKSILPERDQILARYVFLYFDAGKNELIEETLSHIEDNTFKNMLSDFVINFHIDEEFNNYFFDDEQLVERAAANL